MRKPYHTSDRFSSQGNIWRNKKLLLIVCFTKTKLEKKHRKSKFSMLYGAAGRIRTADLILTKDALYLLSYSSVWRPGTGSNRRPLA